MPDLSPTDPIVTELTAAVAGRDGLLVGGLVPQLPTFSGEAARPVIAVLAFVGAVAALWARIPIGMRELARQVLGYADLRAGVLAIDAEQQTCQSAPRADPRSHGQHGLEAKLEAARGGVVERRAALVSGIEGIRLSRLRLKDRIGTPEETERESGAALHRPEPPA